MAKQKIAGITVEIGGDTTKLSKALGDVDKQSKNLKNELKEVEKGLKLNPTSTELLAQKQQILAESVENAKKKLDTLKEAQEQVEQQFKNGEIDEGQYRAFQREVETAEQDLKALTEAEKDFNAEGAKISAVGESFKEVGDKISGVGEKLLPVTAGITALGAASVAAAMDVDNGYDTIITKTGATGEALADLQAQMDELFAELPIDAEEAGTAVGEVNTRFQITGKELKTVSSQFIKFSKITGTDLNSAIDSTDKIMQKFGVDSSRTSEVLGLMTTVGQQTGISMDSLYSALESNGATLKEMGLDLSDSIALLAEFEQNGVDSATALAGLKKAQAEATAEGKNLGVALGESIDAIKNAGTETEALQIATELFGKKGAAEMAQAIREGRLSIDDLSASLEGYGSVVEDTFEATLDPWDDAKVAVNNLKLAGSELAATFLGMLQPAVNKIVEKVKKLKEWFSGLSDSQKETIVKILALVAAIGPLLIIIGKVVSIIGTAITVVGKLKVAIAAVNAVMLANPILIVIAAIAALVAAIVVLYNKCEWFRDLVDEVWAFIKGVWEEAVDILTGVIESVVNAFKTAYDFVKGTIEQAQENVEAALDAITGFFKAAWEAVKLIWGVVVDFFKGIWTGIKEAFAAVGSWFSEKFTTAWDNIKLAWSTVTSFFGNIWTGITSIFSGVGTWFVEKFTAAWTGIKNVFSTVGEFFGGIWDTISEKFTTIGTAIGDAIGGAFKTAINAVIATVETAINAVPTAINAAIDLINELPGVNISKLSTISLPRLAKGGDLMEGQAVVAEAGPELIQLMNGKARVIPLTQSARNTPVTAGAGTAPNVTYYDNYNIYVKSFASPQDARTTSQELARLQRSTDYGKGF